MKVLVIEESPQVQSEIEDYLFNLQVQNYEPFVLSTIEQVVAWFKLNPAPDLVISNTHLHQVEVFDVLTKFEVLSPVVFVSNSPDFVLKALKFNCVDYLLCPLREESMLAALQKFNALNLKNISSKNTYRKRFLVKYGDILLYKTTEEIAYFYADEKITKLVTCDGKKFLVDLSLEALERVLEPHTFYRVNRKFISSLGAIQMIKTSSNNRLQLILKPSFEQEIFISKEKSSNFKLWLDS